MKCCHSELSCFLQVFTRWWHPTNKILELQKCQPVSTDRMGGKDRMISASQGLLRAVVAASSRLELIPSPRFCRNWKAYDTPISDFGVVASRLLDLGTSGFSMLPYGASDL